MRTDCQYSLYQPSRASFLSGKAIGPKGHLFDWMMLKTTDADTPDGKVARIPLVATAAWHTTASA